MRVKTGSEVVVEDFRELHRCDWAKVRREI